MKRTSFNAKMVTVFAACGTVMATMTVGTTAMNSAVGAYTIHTGCYSISFVLAFGNTFPIISNISNIT